MKIRSDFVTNSSSSSFIIALRDDCTSENIKQILLDNKESLKYFVQEDAEYCEYSEEFEELENEEEKINLAVKYLVEEFNSLSSKLKIDNWNIISKEGSNESENILSMYLYCRCGKIDNEKIKIVWSN